MPLANGVSLVSCLLKVTGQETELGGQTCRLVSFYCPPLPAHSPGESPGKEGRPAGGALGVDVVTGENESFSGY